MHLSIKFCGRKKFPLGISFIETAHQVTLALQDARAASVIFILLEV